MAMLNTPSRATLTGEVVVPVRRSVKRSVIGQVPAINDAGDCVTRTLPLSLWMRKSAAATTSGRGTLPIETGPAVWPPPSCARMLMASLAGPVSGMGTATVLTRPAGVAVGARGVAVTVTFVLAAGVVVLMGNVTVFEKGPMATDEGAVAIDGALLLDVQVAVFETVEGRVMVPVA